jgi:hypothetical protein
MGYYRAGFDVVGVDINPQPNYPFTFHQADALTFPLEGYDAIHASPPCQGYTALKAVHGNAHPMLIPQVRERLEASGLPFVIENVAGAPVRRDLMLCGTMFGLPLLRHRFFEAGGFTAVQPDHPKHVGKVRGWRHGQYFDGPYFAVYGSGGGKADVSEAQQALGIDWMPRRAELVEAIPPAYTEYIGTELITTLLDDREVSA